MLIDGFEVPVLFHNIGFRAVTPAETIASLGTVGQRPRTTVMPSHMPRYQDTCA